MQEIVYDISNWQGIVDFNKVKNSGAYGVILKAGGSDAGFYRDWYFEQNYTKAKNAGLHVGAYYFVGKDCKSSKDGEADAIRFINLLKGKQFDLPVYMDFEAPDASNKQGNTDSVIAFCVKLENEGYYAGVYASDIDGFRDKLYLEQLTDYALWVANYSQYPTYAKPVGMWQFSSTSRVDGVQVNVDKNYLYVDYVSAIINNHLNGYSDVSDNEVDNTAVSDTNTVSVNDSVMIKAGAKDSNTNGYYADFVYKNTYKVIEVSGNRVVFGNDNGITGATDISNIIKK